MTSTEIPCPHCGAPNDCHDGTESSHVPGDGDVSICAGCRNIAIYAVSSLGLWLRRPTQAEYEELAKDEEIAAAQAALAVRLGGVHSAVSAWRRGLRP
jgi:hypothetical protein